MNRKVSFCLWKIEPHTRKILKCLIKKSAVIVPTWLLRRRGRGAQMLADFSSLPADRETNEFATMAAKGKAIFRCAGPDAGRQEAAGRPKLGVGWIELCRGRWGCTAYRSRDERLNRKSCGLLNTRSEGFNKVRSKHLIFRSHFTVIF